ncbi:sulfotransferase family protein [Shewanella mangrovi]|nr:sulfotransferase [Shewanella mangrovi]
MMRKLGELSTIVANPRLRRCDTKYLFIFSHMRSRSTVLSHILGSHEQICGYSEQHRSYLAPRDFQFMRASLYQDLKGDFEGKYLLDKLLHNRQQVCSSLLQRVEHKLIFLLRDPRKSISSNVKLGQAKGRGWFQSVDKVTDYYCERLLQLERYAEQFDGRYFFIESEQLVERTEPLLADLSDWLALPSPLGNRYNKFNNTGRPRYGDSSDNINTGKVVKTLPHDEIEIPASLLEKAESAYLRCYAKLSAGCV